jgi:hypothetical protein
MGALYAEAAKSLTLLVGAVGIEPTISRVKRTLSRLCGEFMRPAADDGALALSFWRRGRRDRAYDS